MEETLVAAAWNRKLEYSTGHTHRLTNLWIGYEIQARRNARLSSATSHDTPKDDSYQKNAVFLSAILHQ
jgi:hypothetical protein